MLSASFGIEEDIANYPYILTGSLGPYAQKS